MTNFTTVNSTALPPSPAAHPGIPAPTAVVCLVALITMPMIAYTLFVAMKCPRNPFRRSAAASPAEAASYKAAEKDGAVDAAAINDQCPVCLSAFAEGEEIRQLGACKHAFHAACVDMWLYSHSSCPVCRAAVPVKRSRRVLMDGEDDFRQGLPDAANLI
ncbi:RING-H2 finger protein atl33 [Phtheirospermum japonicum]|uniref:RING-H2 finger protein atl33 n=1 Tax=Phtheirospermum japonicum TaxID=374723 RepID=A0A830BVD1_9LAMI|nr:RING-H2 finger protein atl33 [Phtheirospermum japonicum]